MPASFDGRFLTEARCSSMQRPISGPISSSDSSRNKPSLVPPKDARCAALVLSFTLAHGQNRNASRSAHRGVDDFFRSAHGYRRRSDRLLPRARAPARPSIHFARVSSGSRRTHCTIHRPMRRGRCVLFPIARRFCEWKAIPHVTATVSMTAWTGVGAHEVIIEDPGTRGVSKNSRLPRSSRSSPHGNCGCSI